MRKTTTTVPGTLRAPAGVPGPPSLGVAGPLKTKKRTNLVALGVVMVVVGALVAAWLVASSGHAVQVLAVAKFVGRGDRIGSGDVVAVEVTVSHGVDTVPAASAHDVVGKVATADLLPGTLLSPAGYASALAVGEGRSMVGVALDTSHRPTADLHAGDPVRFVQGPVANGELLGSKAVQVPAVVVSTAFMTDAVLEESLRLNPITDIEVVESSHYGGAGYVTMGYRFGETRVFDDYGVERFSDGFWRITSGSGGFVTLDMPEAAENRVTLNGVAVDLSSERVELLPGTYRVGSTNPLLTSPDMLVLPELSSRFVGLSSGFVGRAGGPRMRLTPEGQQAVADAVETLIDGCVQEPALRTSCGLVFSSSVYEEYGVPVESTMRWSVGAAKSSPAAFVGEMNADPCVPALSAREGMWAVWTPTAFERVEAVGTLTLGTGEVVVVTSDERLQSYVVDISDPDHLVVYLRWSSSWSWCEEQER